MSNISEQLVNDLRERTGRPKVREPIYKVGDRVKLLESGRFSFSAREFLTQLDPPFVVTIKRTTGRGYYFMKENNSCWWRGNIEGLYIEPIPVMSRFELLDL